MAQNSLLQRIKSAYQVLTSNNAQKTAYSPYPFIGYAGLDARNQDLARNEYGAAQASQLLVDIAASLQVWESFLDGVTWHIKDISTGETIVSSDERVFNGQRGANFFKAVKAFQTYHHHSYWKSIVDSDMITGETYVYRVPNGMGYVNGLQWLNPLLIEPDTSTGRITHYNYSNYGARDTVPYIIPADAVAYRMMRRNMFDDLRGFSGIMSVIDESNLSRNAKRAFEGYFRNGMILGGLVTPVGNNTWSRHELQKVEEQLNLNNRGTKKAHSWAIFPREANVNPFDNKNAGQDIATLETLSAYIHKALGVPDVLTGTATDATYENLSASEYSFYRLRCIPYAKEIATYHNEHIIPYFGDKTIYLEPELSKYETERPEIVSQDVDSGVIDMYQAQIKRGMTDADESLKGVYIINGRPMHRDTIIELANTMPASEVADRANAAESLADAQADTMQPVSEDVEADSDSETDNPFEKSHKAIAEKRSAFAYIPLANHPQILSVMRMVKNAMPKDNVIEWQSAPTYHITLAYGQNVSDEDVNSIVDTLDVPSRVEIASSSLATFDTPDGYALHLVVDYQSSLGDLQELSWIGFNQIDAVMPQHFEPEQYKPHITLGYLKEDTGWQKLADTVDLLIVQSPAQVIIGRDDYEPVAILTGTQLNKSLTITHGNHTHEIAIAPFEPTHTDAESELKAWYKVASKSLDRAASFAPAWLRGDIADELSDKLASVSDSTKSTLDALFNPYFERVRVKAVQATRLGYEGDVEELLTRARDDNNFGRTQWASAMRAIIRRYSRKAYEDGLIDGGVLDGQLDDDDETQLRDHIREQSQYVTNLGEKIYKDDKFTLTDTDIRNKPAMWYNKSISPAYQLGKVSADGNSMYEWVIGATEESCRDCVRLNGQRHRLKTYQRRGMMPQSDILACNGFNCKCSLVKVMAKARGNF